MGEQHGRDILWACKEQRCGALGGGVIHPRRIGWRWDAGQAACLRGCWRGFAPFELCSVRGMGSLSGSEHALQGRWRHEQQVCQVAWRGRPVTHRLVDEFLGRDELRCDDQVDDLAHAHLGVERG
jgi:hypothetical protein